MMMMMIVMMMMMTIIIIIRRGNVFVTVRLLTFQREKSNLIHCILFCLDKMNCLYCAFTLSRVTRVIYRNVKCLLQVPDSRRPP
jgi:hypothetical protein